MSSDWLWMSMGDLGRGIAAGKIDPAALTEKYLAAIDAHPARDRIYTVVTPERARAEAAAAAERAALGQRRGPLDGVPISWKDLFDSAGVATEAGSKLLAGRVPGRDAEVLRRATAAGLVCLGKTHMTELAFSGLGYNPSTATPPCVNDPEVVPGGSSSGAASSVAQGLAACGIGSDTGGSVRIPSAWNDLVGLKTTSTRIPLDGVVPLAARFDTIGPLARTVEDAALMFGVLDMSRPVDLRGATLHGKRFLVLETVVLGDLHAPVESAFWNAVERMTAAGAQIDRGPVPLVEEAMALAPVTVTSEAYGTWQQTLEAAPEKMFDVVRERFRSGKDHAATDFVAAWQRLDALHVAWAEAVAGYDAVLVPSVPHMPPRVEDLAANADLFVSENLFALRNTRVANLLGLTSLTLPTGVPSTGVMLYGPAMGEEALLRLGAAVEAALA